jgi:hypothetical protein
MSENKPEFNFEEFSLSLEVKRKQARRKAIIFTFIPIVASIILVGYCTASVNTYQEQVKTLSDSAQKLSLDARLYDSLVKSKEDRVQQLNLVLTQVIDSANLVIKRSDVSGADSNFVKEIAKLRPAIVFIQVADLHGKRLGKFRKELQSLGYIVPEIELMGKDDYPNHIQYYYAEDSIAASHVLEKCHVVFPEKTFTNVLYKGTKYNAPKGQIEVWVKNGVH